MGSPIEKELKCLSKYVKGSEFIIETGSGGSTFILSKACKGSYIYSIDIKVPRKNKAPNVKYMEGWSVTYEDLIKPNHPDFVESRYKNLPDGNIVFKGKQYMGGRDDLIRTILSSNRDKILDFFFCDTGEYTGLAEWNIVKDAICIGGKFAIHDIYYPKSIKGFKVVDRIERSDNWKVLEKTDDVKGLLIAERVK